MAGPGSWEHFRENFSKALAEVFANFFRYPGNVTPEEFSVFESLYRELVNLPSYPLSSARTSDMYERAKAAREPLRPASESADSGSGPG